MGVRTSVEGPRGCGYRKPGGLYLVSAGAGEDCAKLPIRLTVCPTCGQGIKPTRGWTWLQPNALVDPEPHGSDAHAAACPLSTGVEKCGLLWIGGSYYPTPASFIDEAERMGISRRIPAVPRDFKLGEWVFLAHREADWDPCPDCADGPVDDECPECDGKGKVPVRAVFYVFRPTGIEYVVKGDESTEDLERMEKRGIEPVHVIPDTEQQTLGGDES